MNVDVDGLRVGPGRPRTPRCYTAPPDWEGVAFPSFIHDVRGIRNGTIRVSLDINHEYRHVATPLMEVIGALVLVEFQGYDPAAEDLGPFYRPPSEQMD